LIKEPIKNKVGPKQGRKLKSGLDYLKNTLQTIQSPEIPKSKIYDFPEV
jgi:hypothetical protein